jgi:hypothetical protein
VIIHIRKAKSRQSHQISLLYFYGNCYIVISDIYVFILQVGNAEHMRMVKDMGISILTLPDGRVQFLHTFANVSFYISVFVKQDY